MTRLGAWVRAQRLFGWGQGAVSDHKSGGVANMRYQVGYLESNLMDDSDKQFTVVGVGSTWKDAYRSAAATVEEWKENGWWPSR